MKRYFFALIVVVLFVSPSYGASRFGLESRSFLKPLKVKRIVKANDLVAYGIHARGKKGRKYIRRFSLRENLRGDKLRAYEIYGYTPHRLRFLTFGKITERWRYYSLGLELTFDEEGNLISQSRFSKEEGHID